MKTNGFVGTIALAVLCSTGPSALRAQTPVAGPSDDVTAGTVRIQDGPAQSEVPPGTWHSPGAEGEVIAEYEVPVEADPGSSDFFGRPRQRQGGFFAGGSFLSLEAEFGSDTAFFIEDQTGATTVTTERDFPFDEEGAPRVWAGWQDQWGLGVRVTWFEFTDDSRAAATADDDFIFFNGLRTPTAARRLLVGGSAGDFIQAETSFEVYAIDAELVQELNFRDWQTTFGGGFRHGAVSQEYRAVGTASGTFAESQVDYRFDGEGPTVFGQVEIPVIGTPQRPGQGSVRLSLYGHARGSVLFGDAKLKGLDINPANPTAQRAFADLKDDEGLGIGEARVGVQVDLESAAGHLVFVRGGWESQWWSGAGSLTSLQEDNDFVLEGWTLSGGLEW